MSKKILFISARLGYDSLLYWNEPLKAIKKHFNNFRVFTAWPTLYCDDNKMFTEYKLTGFKWFHKKGTAFEKVIFLPMPFFLKEVYAFSPDVIIINEFNLASFWVVLFKFLFKKSKILLLSESDPGLGIGKYSEGYFKNKLRRFIVSKVDLILTNNEFGKSYLNDLLGAAPDKIVQLPYMTSCPNVFTESSSEENETVFLYVGQLIERKGIDQFLNALSLLPTTITNQMKVNILGDGDLRDKLEDKTKKLKLDFVSFKGRQPYENVSLYYQEADVFVLPTLYDYRALVGFESLHYGCAVVTSIFDGARNEVVREGENGFVIDPNNPQDFSNKLLLLIEDKNLLEKLKLKSLEISKSFTVNDCNNNIIKTISSLLTSKS